jgi:HlyD family type I secretion membrane fusion protein
MSSPSRDLVVEPAFNGAAGLGLRPEQRINLLVPNQPPVRSSILFGVVAAAVFLGSFSAWTVLAPLSRAAVGDGMLQSINQRRVIQHLEGGIVSEILVRDGDTVKKGDVLMRLDRTLSGDNEESLRYQIWSERAELARLQAEQSGAAAVAFPPDLEAAARTLPLAADAIRRQQELFAARTANLESELKMIGSKQEQARTQIGSAEGQIVSLDRQLALIRDELVSVQALYHAGLETRPHLLALQRNEASIIGNRNEQVGQKARAENTVAEEEAHARQIRDQRQQEVSTQISDAILKLADTETRLRSAQHIAGRTNIVAPDDGTVLNLRFFTIGAVVRAGDPVMDLVPAHEDLVATVNIAPQDINDVSLGLSAEVRFPAFSSRLTPNVGGKVIFVAPDATLDDRTHAPSYRVQVRIDPDDLKTLPKDEHLVAGMPVAVQIKAGSRTLLQYLVKPFRDSLYRAFVER